MHGGDRRVHRATTRSPHRAVPPQLILPLRRRIVGTVSTRRVPIQHTRATRCATAKSSTSPDHSTPPHCSHAHHQKRSHHSVRDLHRGDRGIVLVRRSAGTQLAVPPVQRRGGRRRPPSRSSRCAIAGWAAAPARIGLHSRQTRAARAGHSAPGTSGAKALTLHD
jgi:hypothetical protein